MAQKGLRKSMIIISLLLLGSLSFFLFSVYQNPEINDNFLRTHLKKYPEATIFKIEYLDFFTPGDAFEKQCSLEYKRKYILKGDFNKNGRAEIAISGLLSKKADKDHKYSGFVLILEKGFFGYKTLYFQKFLKEPNSLIKNLFLFRDSRISNGICIGFANNSGLISIFSWNNGKYKFEWDSESW